MQPQLFELPVPPSTNNLTATIVRGRYSRRIKTAQYKSWLDEASVLLRVQRVQPVPSPVRIGVSIVPGKGMNRQRDCDNFLKGICDLLVACGIIEGDSLAHVIGVEVEFIRMGGRPGQFVASGQAYCLVEVTEA